MDIEPLRIEILRSPAYCMIIEEEPNGEPWYHDILDYLQNSEFPQESDASNRKYLTKLASKFFVNGGALYKRSFDSTLLRCVNAKETNRLMKEIHEGDYGPHMNGHLLWGIDVIEPINPKASNGHRFILVTIDYFTKWIEANSYANVTAKNVAKFIRSDIIARYGVPKSKLDETEWIQQRHESLNTIDGKKLKAICHGQCYQKRVTKAFNQKVRPRHFEVNDLVLRKVLPIILDPRGKFTPNYEGPYVIKKILPGGAMVLVEMDSRELSKPVNTNVVKKYFP
ncbi:uncharacterized protein LOC120291946 [Eucalyptus grandis]|uniref:uncharacterized protein LOC120291946 n=1 Tax=Eucalyptus grandis TaxID=71139 RepID=UPI00192EE359|nr:uncharacterized protein LOC120291946 [Eucalyptus grandis]